MRIDHEAVDSGILKSSHQIKTIAFADVLMNGAKSQVLLERKLRFHCDMPPITDRADPRT